MPRDDFDLKKSDIQTLDDRDTIASLFITLGYDVDRISQTTDALGITNDSLKRQIEHVEQLVLQDDYLFIYLFEMKSMRVSDRQALVRSFRNAQGDQLIVVTSDYETIDFVYFEREQPRDSAGNPMRNKQVIMQPHVLTVNRRNPDRIALRVLRRFTDTESDVIFQLDKLLSAYTVGKWSCPMFNNRALFSDYYLDNRLQEIISTPPIQKYKYIYLNHSKYLNSKQKDDF